MTSVDTPASHFCAAKAGQADANLCGALTRIPSKNKQFCTARSCLSPWRLCAACIREDTFLPPNKVQRLGGELCTFHNLSGREAVRTEPTSRPLPKKPVKVVYRVPPVAEKKDQVKEKVPDPPAPVVEEATPPAVPVPDEKAILLSQLTPKMRELLEKGAIKESLALKLAKYSGRQQLSLLSMVRQGYMQEKLL